MSPVCKMADNGRLTVDQKVKVVLFYTETKSVVATQRRFRAHFGTRWVPCKQTIYRLSLGIIFQPMRINSVPDVKCYCEKQKCVMCTNNGTTFRAPLCSRCLSITCAVLSWRLCKLGMANALVAY